MPHAQPLGKLVICKKNCDYPPACPVSNSSIPQRSRMAKESNNIDDDVALSSTVLLFLLNWPLATKARYTSGYFFLYTRDEYIIVLTIYFEK